MREAPLPRPLESQRIAGRFEGLAPQSPAVNHRSRPVPVGLQAMAWRSLHRPRGSANGVELIQQHELPLHAFQDAGPTPPGQRCQVLRRVRVVRTDDGGPKCRVIQSAKAQTSAARVAWSRSSAARSAAMVASSMVGMVRSSVVVRSTVAQSVLIAQALASPPRHHLATASPKGDVR